ncbi:MAG: hypothetical protein ISR68_01725 [Campylobacterales bacterium]|nr:hypothetical protein [Campylobacterales bacterium]
MREIEDLKKDFENFKTNGSYCEDGSCSSDEETKEIDYPNYTDALFAKIVAPHKSGIYISRWDIKEIAKVAGEDMAIHPRKRMFELLMKYATTKENMQSVLDSIEAHFNEKTEIYKELKEAFPASAEIFESKIEKANKTIESFPAIIDEYFIN